MPSKTDYERKTKYKTTTYRGERGLGGNIVHAGDTLLDKHLFVHSVAPGGFDWGPDADDDRACQLAIALLAPLKGVDDAIENYHIFATNFVKRDLSGDSWEIKRTDLRKPAHLERHLDREYPENTAPSPEDVPALDHPGLDLDGITYAEELALAEKYKDVLWTRGNRRDNLRRLQAIWSGQEDPSDDPVSRSDIYHMISNVSSTARRTLSKQFDTMGELAGWVVYGRNHARLDGISSTAAGHIRESRDEFIRYFGGEEYIPEHDDGNLSLDFAFEGSIDAEQQTLSAQMDSDEGASDTISS